MTALNLFCLSAGLLLTTSLGAQVRKLDTTAKMGDVGYRVSCSNKKLESNPISINPVGFKSGARPAYFAIKGIVSKIVVDDFNDDGYPDLAVFVYTGDSTERGSVIGICSHENTEIQPAYFPDIYNDPKLRIGYKGHDVFTEFAGTILRTFPIYKVGDNGAVTDTLSGSKRVVQYKVAAGEEGHLAFKVLRSYEKQE